MANNNMDLELIERVVIGGDLMALSPKERLNYYVSVCQSIGVNPMTKPFDYLMLGEGDKKKLVLYPNADCAAQLRSNRTLSIKILSRERVGSVYIVTAQAADSSGRSDEATGAVPLGKQRGQWETSQSGKRYFKADADGAVDDLSPADFANAVMKAETKAKRRVTFSFCGFGMDADIDPDFPETRNVTAMIEVEDGKSAAEHVSDLFGAPVIPAVSDTPPKTVKVEHTNGNGKQEPLPIVGQPHITNANQLIDAANALTGAHYKNVFQAKNALNIKTWPAPTETETWKKYLSALVDRVNAEQQAA